MAIKDNSNEEMRVCIHCGENVASNIDICPSCGLPVDGSELTNDSNDVQQANNNNKKSDFPISMVLVGILVIVAIVFVVIFLMTRSSQKSKQALNTLEQAVINESTVSKEEITEKFGDLNIKDPKDANDLKYSMDGDGVVKLSYEKVIDKTKNITMNLVMRIAKSTEDIDKSIGLYDSSGNEIIFPDEPPIFMNVQCDDGAEVPVESYIAVDENGVELKYMRSTWYDNDNYYSMVTDNLTTREDFLQEVNRVIIANHEAF